MTLYLLKVHLQTFLSTPITQKCQILICNTLVANERYVVFKELYFGLPSYVASFAIGCLVSSVYFMNADRNIDVRTQHVILQIYTVL